MKPAVPRAVWVACLGLTACAPHVASEASPDDAAEATPGDSAHGAEAREPFERCLEEHGWAPPARFAPSARELAIRIAAVTARCQPPFAVLEHYARELSNAASDSSISALRCAGSRLGGEACVMEDRETRP